MKNIPTKIKGVFILEPETVMEAVEHLEEFLCADFGAKDWNEGFLHIHFNICKDQIKKVEDKKLKKVFDEIKKMIEDLNKEELFIEIEDIEKIEKNYINQPIQIEDHYNCGVCGCSHNTYNSAENCRH